MADAPGPGPSADAPRVVVRLPGLLARFSDGERTVAVRAGTVGESLDRLLAAYPALAPHLHDGTGRLRPHLTLLHNGTPVTGLDAAATPLADGDEVVVLQAVSGGSAPASRPAASEGRGLTQ